MRFIYSNWIEPLTRRNILPTRAIRATRNNVGLTRNLAIISPNVCPRNETFMTQIESSGKMSLETSYQEWMQLQ